MKFQQEIKKHLSEYKKNKFPNLPNGKWRKIEYEHILPKENMSTLGYILTLCDMV